MSDGCFGVRQECEKEMIRVNIQRDSERDVILTDGKSRCDSREIPPQELMKVGD